MKHFILLAFFLTMSIFSTAQNAFQSYKNLSQPERKWVRHHPLAALRTYKLSQMAAAEAQTLVNDPEFDGDGSGGMVDAFRHTLWMALTAQKIGKSKALALGRAHEEKSKLYFESCDPSTPNLPDSIDSEMDFINNQKGADIGTKYPKATFEELVQIVRSMVVSGQCYKIKKNSKGEFLDYDGNVIPPEALQGKWITPKILVKSDWRG